MRDKRKEVLKYLIQALFVVALFQLVKGKVSQENIAYIFTIHQWKDNGILLEKIGKLSYFIKDNYLFPDPTMISQVIPSNKTVSVFILHYI